MNLNAQPPTLLMYATFKYIYSFMWRGALWNSYCWSKNSLNSVDVCFCTHARTGKLMHTEEHISTDTQTHNPNTGTNGCARMHEYTFTRCLSLTQECVFAHRELIIDACSAQKHSMQADTHTRMHAIHQPLLAQSSHMHAHVYVRARTYKCATLKSTQKALITPIPRRAHTHTPIHIHITFQPSSKILTCRQSRHKDAHTQPHSA